MAPVRIFLLVAIVCLMWSSFAAVHADSARPLLSPSEEPGAYEGRRFDLVRRRSPTDAQSAPQEDYLTRSKLARYEIRYAAPKAEAVYLLWALDNWQSPDKSLWPPGSTARKQYPYCKMRRDGDVFVISLSVPEGATLDYCFNALIPSRGLDIWDTNGAAHRDYHSKVVPNGAAVIIAQGCSTGRGEESSKEPALPRSARVIAPVVAVTLLVSAGVLVRRARPNARGAR